MQTTGRKLSFQQLLWRLVPWSYSLYGSFLYIARKISESYTAKPLNSHESDAQSDTNQVVFYKHNICTDTSNCIQVLSHASISGTMKALYEAEIALTIRLTDCQAQSKTMFAYDYSFHRLTHSRQITMFSCQSTHHDSNELFFSPCRWEPVADTNVERPWKTTQGDAKLGCKKKRYL